MTINPAGLDLIKQFESCRLRAYQDAEGVWTVGWGHTGPTVHPGTVLTPFQADKLLELDVNYFERSVTAALDGAPTTANQFSAMVCLAYNIGSGAFRRSTVLRQHRNGNYRLAAAAFLLWIKAGGKPLRGLIRRRNAERILYLSN